EVLAEAEEKGVKFAESAFGGASLATLRSKSAQELLDASLAQPRPRFAPFVDGYVFPADGRALFGTGRQAHVPLLAGWNLDEGSERTFFGNEAPTLENFRRRAREKFGNRAEAFL